MKWWSPGDSDTSGGGRTDRAAASIDFAAHFQDSFRSLWLIAAGIVGDAHRAEDVVQEAAIVGYRKLSEFDPKTSFRAWMGQIVRNVARNTSRHERRRRAGNVEDAAPAARPSVQPGIDRDAGGVRLHRDEFDERVVRALDGLGEDARTCLLLRVIDGAEYAEIAKLLEIPEGTAMSHVFRARKHLRERLAGDFTGFGAAEGRA